MNSPELFIYGANEILQQGNSGLALDIIYEQFDNLCHNGNWTEINAILVNVKIQELPSLIVMAICSLVAHTDSIKVPQLLPFLKNAQKELSSRADYFECNRLLDNILSFANRVDKSVSS